jgi:hypothetical protein
MLDHQVGWAVETTYNTPITVTRFGEWLPGNGLDWNPNVVQGEGLRVGSAVARSARRVALIGRGEGKLQFELASKGFGSLLKACWGAGASTVVSGTTYQQLFSMDLVGTYLDSLTIQEGIVKPGGDVDAYTYGGCTIKSFEIEQGDGLCQLTVDVDARSLATSTALATASYPTSPTLFNAGSPISGAMTAGGTLTVPTTTALASVTSGTSVAVKSWTLSVDNGIDEKRDVLGGRKQPVVGQREVTLKTTVEYDATTGTVFRDAYIGQTSTPILLTLTTAETLSAGVATMQLALPACYIDGGPIPQPGEGEVVTTDIEWAIRDNLTDSPAYMVLLTADTAL